MGMTLARAYQTGKKVYIIDMGPEGGSEGGKVLFCGTPDKLINI